MRLNSLDKTYIVNIQPEDLGFEHGWGQGRGKGKGGVGGDKAAKPKDKEQPSNQGKGGQPSKSPPGKTDGTTEEGPASPGSLEAQELPRFKVVVAVGRWPVAETFIQPIAPPIGRGNGNGPWGTTKKDQHPGGDNGNGGGNGGGHGGGHGHLE